jgi:hypothetical protein
VRCGGENAALLLAGDRRVRVVGIVGGIIWDYQVRVFGIVEGIFEGHNVVLI